MKFCCIDVRFQLCILTLLKKRIIEPKRKGFRCVNINIIDDKKYEISRRYNLI